MKKKREPCEAMPLLWQLLQQYHKIAFKFRGMATEGLFQECAAHNTEQDVSRQGQTWEDGLAQQQLCHDAAHRPHINGGCVVCRPKDQLWGSVVPAPSHHITPHHTTPHHTTSHHTTSHHLTPHHTTPHHTTQHPFTSYHITSHTSAIVGCVKTEQKAA